MQRPGKMGLRGESFLGFEVVEALLEESAGAEVLVGVEAVKKRADCLTGLLCILSFLGGAERA